MISAVLYDSPLYSPYIVPVAGTFMVLGIVVAGIWSGVRNREMQSQERLAAIAKGIPIEPTWDEAMVRQATQGQALAAPGRKPNDGSGARRVGIVLVSTAIGLATFFWALAVVLRERDVLSGCATGLIPLAIGVGFLIDARLRRTEWDRARESMRNPDAVSGAQPPELRPLH